MTLALPQPIRILLNGSYVEQYLSAPRGVAGKAKKIIRQASLCPFVSFLSRCFLLRPQAQDTHAYDMIGRIIAVYIHFIINGFIFHVLPTICLHCVNTVVALRVIRVICLLSRETLNSLASLESLSFEPFIDKEPKSEFRL